MHAPLWMDGVTLPEGPAVDADLSCHVCVVGAGMAGVCTAYRLARAGHDVILLDAEGVGAGETRYTSAHLASAQDDRFRHLEDLHGQDGARLAAESHAAAIDWIEEVARAEGIDCAFTRVPGYLFAGPEDGPSVLEEEYEAALRAGLEVELLDEPPVPKLAPPPVLRFAHQARFHPVRFLAGLARAYVAHGGRLFGGTRVVDVDHSRGEGPREVRTAAGHTVRAEHVVLATNSPAGHYLTTMKMVPYQTFVTALRLTGRVPDALYWDTADPYHYVRLIEDAASPLLLVGGGDYQSGTRDEGKAVFNELAAWARQRFPVAEAVASWSGQVLEPADAMAFIGRAETEARVWVVTGDSGQGLTHGAIAGLLLGDLIEGRDHPWAELYAPSRLTAGATGSYLKDALKVGKGFAGWLRPGDVGSEADIQPGQGAIVRHGAVPMAVYRDEDGALHRRSAVCTHAGCIVGWNSTATTWDCPCHGSRFAPTGEVIHGPAVKGLADPSSE